jgi:hypothetical protein
MIFAKSTKLHVYIFLGKMQFIHPPQTKLEWEVILESSCLSVCLSVRPFVRTRNLFVVYFLYSWTDFIQTLCISFIYNVVVHLLFSLKCFNMYGSYEHFLFILGAGLYLHFVRSLFLIPLNRFHSNFMHIFDI